MAAAASSDSVDTFLCSRAEPHRTTHRQFGEKTTDELFEWKTNLALGAIEAEQFYSIIVPGLENLAPQCLHVVEGFNAKDDLHSYQATSRQSANHSIANKEAWIQEEKCVTGIFLCPGRCPESLHYCRKGVLDGEQQRQARFHGKS